MRTPVLIIITLLILNMRAIPLSADGTFETEVEDAANHSSSPPGRPTIRIEARVDNGRFRKVLKLDLRTDQTPTLRVKLKESATVRWYLIFADLTRNYQNANTPWEDEPYKWTGFDRIQYYRIEVAELRNKSEINPVPYLEATRHHIVMWREKFTGSTDGTEFYHGEVGTFWIQVEVEDEKGVRRSAGVEDNTDRGLSQSVFRLTLRRDDSFLGYLSGLYNVPGVFGSVLSQSIHHIGADCADVLMTARSEWKRQKLTANYNVQMLVTKLRKVAQTKIALGAPLETLKWGESLHPGDFIAVSYSEDAKKYHHIGALLSDENGDGILDPKDSVLHAGPEPLHKSLLEEGGFDGTVVILRP